MSYRNSREGNYELPFLLCVILALILMLSFMGCGVKHTRPEGVPYPIRLGPQVPQASIGELRCFGGGLGGCSGWHLAR